MTFGDWLMTQRDRDDPIGDLANDAISDPKAPKSGSVETWRTYLVHTPGACHQALETLEDAIWEFQGQ